MMQGYFLQRENPAVVFDMFFRRQPFGGGFSVFAGLDTALAHIGSLSFSQDDLAYLESLGTFRREFLDELARFEVPRGCMGDAGRHPRVPGRAAGPRARIPDRGAARRERAAGHPQLPDPHRHEDGANPPGRATAVRSWSSGSAGRRASTVRSQRPGRRLSAAPPPRQTPSRGSSTESPCAGPWRTPGSWPSRTSGRPSRSTRQPTPTAPSCSSIRTTRWAAGSRTRSTSGRS